MKYRFIIIAALFLALVAGAWFALRPPELPKAGSEASAPPVNEARAAAIPSSSKLGAAAVLSIDPRTHSQLALARPANRSTLFNEYLSAKSYKALYDRLAGSPEGQTPEGWYVMYDILRKCATVTDRPRNGPPIVRTTEQGRAQFLASIPPNDPLRDKRIAAYDDVATNRCAGMEGVQVTQASLDKLLADAAAAGDPKAQALTLEQQLWSQRRAEGWMRSTVAPTDAQIEALRASINSRDPEAMLIAGRVLSSSWHDFSLRIGDSQVVEQRSFMQAWQLLACDYGYPCGDSNQRLLSACAYQGHCNAQSLPDYIFYYGASPYDSQLLTQYREVLRSAIETGDWSQVNVVRGPVPAQARATNNPPGPGR